MKTLSRFLPPFTPFQCSIGFLVPSFLGGRSAQCSEHSSQRQEEEDPHGAARQTQGVPAAQGERGGGQAKEAEGGAEKTVPCHGPDRPKEAQVQSEGGAAGRLTHCTWTREGSPLDSKCLDRLPGLLAGIPCLFSM